MKTTSRASGKPRRKKTTTRKISLNLTPEAAEIIERLSEENGITLSEVVRRALALAAFYEDQTRKGATLLVTHDNGKTFKEIYFLR